MKRNWKSINLNKYKIKFFLKHCFFNNQISPVVSMRNKTTNIIYLMNKVKKKKLKANF